MDEIDNQDDLDETGSEESAVLKELRKKTREQAEKLKEFEAKAAEAEAAAQTQRSEAASKIVNSLNLPGLAEDILNWVEGPITEASVTEALKARSIPLPEDYVQPEPEEVEPPKPSASNVGQRVADVAGGADKRSLDRKLAEAQSAAEVATLMEEAGLVRSHS